MNKPDIIHQATTNIPNQMDKPEITNKDIGKSDMNHNLNCQSAALQHKSEV